MLRCARRPTRLYTRSFTVLAVESSADDTCAAIVGSDRRIHSNIVIKQNHVYALVFGRYNVPNLNYYLGTSRMAGYIHIVPYLLTKITWFAL